MTTCFTQITLITLILCMIGLRAVMSHMYHKSYFKSKSYQGTNDSLFHADYADYADFVYDWSTCRHESYVPKKLFPG